MRKNGVTTIVVIALVVAVVALLNPTMADFQDHLSAKAAGKAAGAKLEGIGGVLQKGAGALAGGVAALAAGLYSRKDYFLFSTYSIGEKGDLYLGVAKKLFLKLR